jgi:hypothetical protein
VVLVTKSNITEVAAGRWRGSAKDQRTSQVAGGALACICSREPTHDGGVVLRDRLAGACRSDFKR